METAATVFFSYNSNDFEVVERIAVLLQDRHSLTPWLDRWELIPGREWITELHRGLQSAAACVVCVGKNGEGPWQRREIFSLLQKQAKNPSFPVIPVMLPGCPGKPDLPPFLDANMWVAFSDTDDAAALYRLACGVRGEKPGRFGPADAGRDAAVRPEPDAVCRPENLAAPGGAVDVNSRFYIRRDADESTYAGLLRERGLVTVRGASQTGKTSLMCRIIGDIKRARIALRPVVLDFQEALTDADRESIHTLWTAAAEEIAGQLGADELFEKTWKPGGRHHRNLNRFVERLFTEDQTPVLLCLDEVNRVFGTAAQSDFFASIRAAFNRGAREDAWKRVRWLLCTSSEPAFFIEDLSQSPFNIGARIQLDAFTPPETAAFARRHGIRPDNGTLRVVDDFLGGRPYLVHLLFHHAAIDAAPPARYLDAGVAGGGIFRDHLVPYLRMFQRDNALGKAMKRVIKGDGCRDVRMAERLESAGLARRDDTGRVVCACGLYADFFGKALT